jgi:hypothetical protein
MTEREEVVTETERETETEETETETAPPTGPEPVSTKPAKRQAGEVG